MRWWYVLPIVVVGIWSGQYLAAILAFVWFAVEHRARKLQAASLNSQVGGFSRWLTLYGAFDAVSHRVMESEMKALEAAGNLSREQASTLTRLRTLTTLRSYLFGKDRQDKHGALRAILISSPEPKWFGDAELSGLEITDVAQAALDISELYWKMYELASGGFGDLTLQARALYRELRGEAFQRERAREWIEPMTDRMQAQGIVFAVLNCHAMKRSALARNLLSNVVSREEFSTLHWITEVLCFEPKNFGYEESLRYLYHQCLSHPEAAEFLEVDSPYFPQLTPVSEMAREGFCFREVFVDSVLILWEETPGFDAVFCEVLRHVLQTQNKILERKDSWIRYWEGMRDSFSREYLWLVEGNLAYAIGDYRVAWECYQEALKLEPQLMVAKLNRVLVTAKLMDIKLHQDALTAIAFSDDPRAFYVAADSFLLLGNKEAAERLFEKLRKIPGWQSRVDYYASVFCFENGLIDLSIQYAEAALQRDSMNPLNRFHLSQVYHASGDEDRALQVIQGLEAPPAWVMFYRFTIERDAGLLENATKTLKTVPREFFTNASDLEAAIEHARRTQDLSLLRDLKKIAR